MNSVQGMNGLIRLVLRRDRFLLPVWVIFLCVTPLSFVSSFRKLYPTAPERLQFARTDGTNGAFVALYGRLSGSSLGELVAWRSGFVPVMIGLFSLLTVIRHTRTEEESGRLELVNSTAVGRRAGLAAALYVTFTADMILGAYLALGMMSQHLPAGGSIAFGVQFAAAGWMFTAIGALCAQLTESAGGARAIGIAILAGSFLLKVIGEVSANVHGALGWATWLSPLGWAQRIQPYSTDQRWWILAPVLVLTALPIAAAFALSERRDLGAGLLPPRLGPAAAGPALRSPLALAWRLHWPLLAAWSAGFAAIGVVFGASAKSIGSTLNDNKDLRDIFTRLGGRTGLVDTYLSSIMTILGLIAAAYAIQAALKLRAEETAQRAEPVLATSVGRITWAAGHFAFSILGPVVALGCAGLATGLTYGVDAHDVGHQVPRVLGAALLQLPAVWVLAGVAIAMIGLLPRLSPGSWGALGLCLLLSLVGSALRLSHWLLDISPFTHIPRALGGSVSATPLIALLVVAAAIGAAGLTGLRRRAIPG